MIYDLISVNVGTDDDDDDDLIHQQNTTNDMMLVDRGQSGRTL